MKLPSSTLVCLFVAASACRTAGPQAQTPIVQPGPPGESSRVVTSGQAADLSHVGYTPADVEFMQGMITHHAQAVEMTDLLASRTASDAMRKLGERIHASQTDEITMMRHWLDAHGQTGSGPHAEHALGDHLMPGMLTPAEMDRLREARGAEFDRLFLEGMIKHHEGALTMVTDLFAVPAAGQESDIFAFASDVDADQRMEIDRMRAMLKESQR